MHENILQAGIASPGRPLFEQMAARLGVPGGMCQLFWDTAKESLR
jgi:hypothetical protein